MGESAVSAKSQAPTEGSERGRHGSALWIQGLACGACLTFAAPTALLLSVLLAPVLVCILLNSGADRGLLRSVAVACAAASLSPVWHLWLAGDRFDQAIASLSDPFVLLLAWGAGASAWALCQLIPVLLCGSWDMQTAARVRTMEAELKKLNEEWLLDSPPGPQP